MIKLRRKKKINENLIVESQESKSISTAKKFWKDNGFPEDKFEKYLNQLRGTIPTLRTKDGGKFIYGCMRMYLQRQFNSHNDFVTINNILKIIVASHIDEYDRNLNDVTFSQLKRKFGKEISFNINKEKEQIAKLKLTGKCDYEVILIDSFEKAEEYKDYVDWCITYRKDMWENYTLDGLNTFYFMLKSGYKNIKKEKRENCPNDKYGLSMVAVSVCPDGSINSVTCRWNHSNGADDSQYSYVQLSEMLQKNFFDVFKPQEKTSASEKDKIEIISKQIIGKHITQKYDSDKIKLTICAEKYAFINILGYLNFIQIENRKFSKFLFPEWIKQKNRWDVFWAGTNCLGYKNSESKIFIYNINGELKFESSDCYGFLKEDTIINNNFTLTIHDRNFLKTGSKESWTTTWKIKLNQLSNITECSVLLKDEYTNSPGVLVFSFKKDNKSEPYFKLYEFKTGKDLTPEYIILHIDLNKQHNRYDVIVKNENDNTKSHMGVIYLNQYSKNYPKDKLNMDEENKLILNN